MKPQPPAQEDGFFLPDLCDSRAVLMLVVVAELFAVVVVLLLGGLHGFSWTRLALVSLFVQWIALATAFVLCRARPWLERQPALKGWGLAYLVMPLMTMTFTWAARELGALVGMATAVSLVDAMMANTLIAAVLGGLVFRYFFLHSQLMARRQSELKHQIQALHSRIQPHFLFNSMNSIASLISVDPDTAEQVVEDLSALFRASLGDMGQQVPIEREVDLCRRYLRIEQLRLGERLRVRWHERTIPADARIPVLTLQPLLENAIIHGIQPLPEGGEINIRLSFAHGVLEIRVENPVSAPGGVERDGGNRMALDNIRHRLRALYGDRAKMTAYVEGQRYISHLTYPIDPLMSDRVGT